MDVNTAGLRDWLRRECGIDLVDYEALRRWSVEHVGDFWQAMWDHFGLQSPTPHTAALSEARMPGARWFDGAQVNYATWPPATPPVRRRSCSATSACNAKAAASRSAGPS